MKRKEIFYNKLVRDNIPEIIKKKGDEPVYRTLNERDHFDFLNEKLKEDMNEYLADNNAEELADIIEVIYAILSFKGITLGEFEKLRINKLNERGAFNKKIFLEKVIKAEWLFSAFITYILILFNGLLSMAFFTCSSSTWV